MKHTRRSILKAGAGTAIALAASRLAANAEQGKSLLILGGTGFIGPHLTEQSLARGWKVTHFNRGRRDPEVENVETLIGDRKGQLESLQERKWDAVVDNTGYIPKFCKMSADLLAPSTGYCLFISSISAYAGFAKPNDEGSPTGVLANPDEEQVTNDTYGPMKALCERYVLDAWDGGRASVVRPGYIVGPLDPTDRFTYYPVRIAKGGEMAVPGTPADPVQVIDVRDLVRFMLDLVERRVGGMFNAVTAPGELTMEKMIASCQRVTAADTKFTWIDEDFLQKEMKPDELNFAPWNPVRGAEAAASLTGITRSVAEGLRSRPLDETVRDTLAWHATRPPERQAALRSGLSAEREAELLAVWHARKPS